MSETLEVDLHAHAITGKAETLLLSDIHESPDNPRKVFPEGELEAMAVSMRADGFWEWNPLVTWPRGERVEDGFELGAGHRRFRAAQLAGLAQVPVVILYGISEERKLNILNFDNENRDPIHPLHQAEGWRTFMARTGKSVADIASKVGRKVGYVYKRLVLANLIDSVKEDFLDGTITLGHAELIARVSPDRQPFALRACEAGWGAAGLISTRDLQAWIRKNLQTDLSTAPFSLDDAELLPAAGSCTACPHRVGNRPDFDPANDLPQICGDPECYAQKLDAHVEREKIRLQAENGYLTLISDHSHSLIPGVLRINDWHEVPWLSEDPASKIALVAEGNRRGKVIRIVVQERLPLTPPPVKPKNVPAAPGLSKAERDKQNAAAQKQWAKEQREAKAFKQQQEDAKGNLEKERCARVGQLTAILEKVTWPPARETICEMLPDFLNDIIDDLDPLLVTCGVPNPATVHRQQLEKLSDAQLARLCLISYLKGEFEDFNLSRKSALLDSLAKRYSIDVNQVRTRALYEYAVQSCTIDFGASVIECMSESKKRTTPLAEIKFTTKPAGWFVQVFISLPVKVGEGYGESGPLCLDGTSHFAESDKGLWKDRGAAIDAAFAWFAKWLPKVATYGSSTDATYAAAEEVSRWVKSGQAARTAIIALEEKPAKGVKDLIGKLPVMGSPEAGKKKASPMPAAKKPAPKAPAKVAKKGGKK